MAHVVLTERATRAARGGRPWFFADDLAEVDAQHGELVAVHATGQSRPFGLGLHAAEARIRLRVCGRLGSGPVPDIDSFLSERISTAVAQRAAQRASPHPGVRLVHAEADGLPGLVVDQYDDCLAVQITAAALEPHRTRIVPILVATTGAESVVARDDVATRELEGLPRDVRLLHGRRRDRVVIEEDGVRHVVSPFEGQKTGFYLDQRPARAAIRELARGRRVLDLFSYQGAFSLAALAGGAASALAVDQSEPALARAVEGASLNALAGLTTRCGNAFDVLRELRAGGQSFDLIVLDPPAFAKRRSEVAGAIRGYRDLNRLALRALAPGGWLLTCSCSHHLTHSIFEDVLRQSAAGLPFRVLLRRRLMAGECHPVWLSLPESEYLKCHLLQRPE
jgi:23S rRNA (cytosine1962-C5)-methyltransferase